MPLTLGAPLSAFSDQAANFTLFSDVDLIVSQVQFLFTNTVTGGTCNQVFNFSPALNLKNGLNAGIVFNSLPCADQLLPPICGDGVEISCRAAAIDGVTQSPTLTLTLVRSPCASTQISNVFTTLAALMGCIGIDGTIGIEGKLFEVTSSGGIPSPFVNQSSVISIGLLDATTGTFFEYARASTDNTGTFSVGFGIKNRADVAALIPVNGSKSFQLQAEYIGSSTHSRSNIFSTGLSVSGREQDAVCPLGTLLLDTTFVVPSNFANETIRHKITGSFTGKIVQSDQANAQDIMNKIHEAIVTAGAAPVEIKVFRGPDVQVPFFFGFSSLTAPAFNVVATAVGSPIALVALAVILLAVIIILAIFVIALWLIDQIIMVPGGTGVLIAGAIAVIAVAGVGGYFLFSQRKGISRVIRRVT